MEFSLDQLFENAVKHVMMQASQFPHNTVGKVGSVHWDMDILQS